ncbi:MAG: cytochrome C [Rhodobacter sp.]|nr:cytochrome C [Rhodobacter sp.]
MRTPGKMELAAAAWAMAVFLLSTSQARAFFHSGPDLEQGRAIYTANCASCHGANLEGQPNWRTGNEDGTYPAPPHDENGHTWHHGDTMLFDYIKRGGQAALDDMGVDFPSGMPGFGGRLTDEEINVVLDYIKSTWPEDIRAQQEERSTLEAGEP